MLENLSEVRKHHQNKRIKETDVSGKTTLRVVNNCALKKKIATNLNSSQTCDHPLFALLHQTLNHLNQMKR